MAQDTSFGIARALVEGTALLFQERGARKPRFLDWSRTHADDLRGLAARLADGFEPGQGGNAVAETALVLLTLQVAYRTY